ncbi:MAG: hypothetical protein K2W96_00705, partial [Gemmataceae bacterium]|nr:hypothetical protein [Gemmataceae bacterium]
MSIEFECDGCGRMMRARDGMEGARAKCPGCGEVLTVPEAEEEAVPERRPAISKHMGQPLPARPPGMC